MLVILQDACLNPSVVLVQRAMSFWPLNAGALCYLSAFVALGVSGHILVAVCVCRRSCDVVVVRCGCGRAVDIKPSLVPVYNFRTQSAQMLDACTELVLILVDRLKACWSWSGAILGGMITEVSDVLMYQYRSSLSTSWRPAMLRITSLDHCCWYYGLPSRWVIFLTTSRILNNGRTLLSITMKRLNPEIARWSESIGPFLHRIWRDLVLSFAESLPISFQMPIIIRSFSDRLPSNLTPRHEMETECMVISLIRTEFSYVEVSLLKAICSLWERKWTNHSTIW